MLAATSLTHCFFYAWRRYKRAAPNAEFIQAAEGGQAFAIVNQDIDRGLAFAEAISTVAPQPDLERNPDR